MRYITSCMRAETGLDHRLVSRDAYESLVNKNYVKGDVSSKVSATRQQLKRELLQDKITDFLHSRPVRYNYYDFSCCM